MVLVWRRASTSKCFTQGIWYDAPRSDTDHNLGLDSKSYRRQAMYEEMNDELPQELLDDLEYVNSMHAEQYGDSGEEP